jgi:hypothetical protein
MGSGRDQRWFSVGQSGARDSWRAGVEAAAATEAPSDAKLVVVFVSCEYDLERLLKGIRSELGDAQLIGCSTAGEIAASGPGDAGVVITAIGGDGLDVTTAVAHAASEDLRRAGETAASWAAATTRDRKHKVLLMLTDGLAGDQQQIVRGAYSVVGAGIPLVGGCAGDSLRMERTFQLYGDRVLSDSVVAAAIASDAPIGIGVRHGWRRVGEPMLVTKSDANRVQGIDNRAALDVYFERLGVPEEARWDPAAFTAFASTHPLGLASRGAEHHVRFISGADFEDRSLVCIAAVPLGGLVWTMEGDAVSVLEATDGACEDALAGLEGSQPIGLLAFDCIARRGVLGDDGIRNEISRIAGKGDGAPVAGFYTYGEIARIERMAGFHNQTLVVLAVA